MFPFAKKIFAFALTVPMLLIFSISGVAADLPSWHEVEIDAVTLEEAAIRYAPRGDARLLRGASAAGMSMGVASEVGVEEVDEITELASSLENDPRLIYEYVHNTIDYVPYFGFLKGPLLTYLDGSGNDFDQAWLLAALLRASGNVDLVELVYGTMTIPTQGAADKRDLQHWLNVDQRTMEDTALTAIQSMLKHGGVPGADEVALTEGTIARVWVRVSIAGRTHLLDPAFKTYEESDISSIDLHSDINLQVADVRSAAGGEIGPNYVRNLDGSAIESYLEAKTLDLANYIRTHYPTASIENLIGGRKIIPEYVDSLPTELPFAAVEQTAWLNPLSDLTAEPFLHYVRIQHGNIDLTRPIAEIAGRKLSLTYKEVPADLSSSPATLLNPLPPVTPLPLDTTPLKGPAPEGLFWAEDPLLANSTVEPLLNSSIIDVFQEIIDNYRILSDGNVYLHKTLPFSNDYPLIDGDLVVGPDDKFTFDFWHHTHYLWPCAYPSIAQEVLYINSMVAAFIVHGNAEIQYRVSILDDAGGALKLAGGGGSGYT